MFATFIKTVAFASILHAFSGPFSAAIYVDLTGECKLGDVNGNGEVDPLDASLVLQAVVGSLILPDPRYPCFDIETADVSGNKEITAFDAAKILQYVVKLIEKFPAEETATTCCNNVTEFGAVGDGSTDDAAAIQSAINAAYSAGGGIVFFPEGQYNVGTTLNLFSNITLHGTGRSSRIHNTQNGDKTEHLLSSVGGSVMFDDPSRHYGIVIKNLYLTGVSGGGSLVHFKYTDHSYIRNCWFLDWGGYGIFSDNNVHNNFYVNNRFSLSTGNTYSWHAIYANNNHDTLIEGNAIDSCKLRFRFPTDYVLKIPI